MTFPNKKKRAFQRSAGKTEAAQIALWPHGQAPGQRGEKRWCEKGDAHQEIDPTIAIGLHRQNGCGGANRQAQKAH